MGVPKRQQLKIQYVNYYGMLVLYIITILPFLSLYGIRQLLGEDILSSYQTGAVLTLAAMVLLRARRIKLDIFSGLYIVFQGLVIVVTTVNHGFSLGIMVSVCAGIFLILLMQKDLEIILKALTAIAVTAMVLNLFSMLIQGQDEKTHYFIGGKNAFSIFMIPVSFVVLAHRLINKGKLGKGDIVWLFAVGASIIWASSAAGIVTALAMFVVLGWTRRHKPQVWLTLMIVAGIYLVLLVFTELLSGAKWWYSITQLLGKDVTLTSRFSIWNETIEIIRENWLFGVGRGAEIVYKSRWSRMVITSEAHNFVLEILLESGVTGLLLYIALFWSAVKRLDMNSMLHRVAFAALIVMLVNGLVESINNQILVNLLIGLAHSCAVNGFYDRGYGHQRELLAKNGQKNI